MIDSTSSSHWTPQLARVVPSGPAATRPPHARPDRIAAESIAYLRTELLRQPEIRPEVLQRARALAVDPGYPPPSMNQTLARLILDAPDYSEVQA
jgi:hypothetical protein